MKTREELGKAVDDAMARWASAQFAQNDVRDNAVLNDDLRSARQALLAHDVKKFIGNSKELKEKNT
jgi:hypothetical protein